MCSPNESAFESVNRRRNKQDEVKIIEVTELDLKIIQYIKMSTKIRFFIIMLIATYIPACFNTVSSSRLRKITA